MTPSVRAVSRHSLRVLGALFLGLWPICALAQPAAPPPPTHFFTDTAHVVAEDVAARLEQQLRDFQASTSNQILVVVADRVPEGYTSLEEYTNRTSEAWKVGDKSRDNGAVLFVFTGDRKIRIEVGYGLEGALPDALASRIINDEITPRFREGKYGEGLAAGVDAIMRATKGEYQPLARKSSRIPVPLLILVVLFFLFAGVILPFFNEISDIRNSRTYSGRGPFSAGRRHTWGSSGGGWSGGGSSWGGGGGGGGGFSGGGGSFGGGGASGSW